MESTVAHSGLTEIALVALAAMGCGIFMERLRQPAIVGYILAGVLLGPSALALITDRGQIDMLAEMGVLLLLYVVGMELSLRAFRSIWRLAVLTTLIQIGASVGVMLIFWKLFDWTIGLAILLGFVVALSSTAVAIKVLNDIGELRNRTGTITVGVLIAQDIAVVPMMLIVSSLGAMQGVETGFDWAAIPKIMVSIAVLAGLIWYLSSGTKLRLPFSAVVAGHEDLKPLAALGFCFAGAAVSGLLGLSAAYGAFIAGLIIGSSNERQEMLEAAKPIQSILMMVFFLSIGLLLDLGFIWENLGSVAALFFVVVVFKTVLNVGALRLQGQTWPHAFMAGMMFTQIGEFSFLLSRIGVDSGLISTDDSRMVVAVTVLSLALSPLIVLTARRMQNLAIDGRESALDIMRAVYARETELVSETLGGARSSTLRTMGLMVIRLDLIREEWQRRRREKAGGITDAGAVSTPPSNENTDATVVTVPEELSEKKSRKPRKKKDAEGA
ncbi:MAG: cation:proton antiporter [Rhodospirillales bacterium]|jgi:monovalent cation:H+ antiporter-2, CPA2 family|nr:cation:proton antiporter [Rhodospirillales bacterium]MBT4627065.1 cation:proton antiporter [Rhodospirillales bacterium]MBT5350790.1 cation:proton antiporter [Rhodospirillales bacterium]MBT5521369.1 cation:proton antiporter [Rhodospirillales bacterium]MBT6110431.1 cation:proton antiporter [Rhodospirillales bacterium]